MLLAIDVGNSNTSVGLFDRDKQLCHKFHRCFLSFSAF